MKFQDKLKKRSKEELWREYCGFLELSLTEYMYIQRRLMEEQLSLWRTSGLGKAFLRGFNPETVDELRSELPLTTYDDYADILLAKKADMLPAEPIVWIQTTWEGGLRPIKLAPYTRSMLDTYKHNILAAVMLSSGRARGDFNLKKGDRVLYGGAPLPYATGLMPSLLGEELKLTWLPDNNKNSSLSFSQRIKAGFTMGIHGGIDYFFAIGSVANYITENFGKSTGGSISFFNVGLPIAFRYIKAKYVSRRDGRSIIPGDIFSIKGFASTGTDAKQYKDRLAQAWGVTPVEIAAGTESTCLAAETWEQCGMVFFPDACFYEFIPESEMQHNLKDPSYMPLTCLMDEVAAGVNYELVISVLHGGAFMRYRIGDVYHCVSAGGGALPRFTFLDRIPTVIDIAGFTRLSEASIEEVIRLSKLDLGDWLAKKEFDDSGNPFLHMYVEITPEGQSFSTTNQQVLMEHLAVYFKSFDSDYNDLKKLLGMEPLQITILKYGVIAEYCARTGRKLPKINPGTAELSELIRFQQEYRLAYSREIEA